VRAWALLPAGPAGRQQQKAWSKALWPVVWPWLFLTL